MSDKVMRVLALFVGYFILISIFMYFLDNRERSVVQFFTETIILAILISAADIYLFGRLKNKSGKK